MMDRCEASVSLTEAGSFYLSNFMNHERFDEHQTTCRVLIEWKCSVRALLMLFELISTSVFEPLKQTW